MSGYQGFLNDQSYAGMRCQFALDGIKSATRDLGHELIVVSTESIINDLNGYISFYPQEKPQPSAFFPALVNLYLAASRQPGKKKLKAALDAYITKSMMPRLSRSARTAFVYAIPRPTDKPLTQDEYFALKEIQAMASYGQRKLVGNGSKRDRKFMKHVSPRPQTPSAPPLQRRAAGSKPA